MTDTTNPGTVHEGRNVKRFREMLRMKQETFADALGSDWNQKKISLLEAKEKIEPEILEHVAKVLKVPVEAIKNLDEEGAVNIISNTFTDFKDNASVLNYNCNLNFNPLDKMVELYERLLIQKDEIIEILKKR